MDPNFIVDRALGFDLDSELDLCQELATVGGADTIQDVFDAARARRLFQGLLSTGRHAAMSEHWQESVEAGVEMGSLARPEWN